VKIRLACEEHDEKPHFRERISEPFGNPRGGLFARFPCCRHFGCAFALSQHAHQTKSEQGGPLGENGFGQFRYTKQSVELAKMIAGKDGTLTLPWQTGLSWRHPALPT